MRGGEGCGERWKLEGNTEREERGRNAKGVKEGGCGEMGNRVREEGKGRKEEGGM